MIKFTEPGWWNKAPLNERDYIALKNDRSPHYDSSYCSKRFIIIGGRDPYYYYPGEINPGWGRNVYILHDGAHEYILKRGRISHMRTTKFPPTKDTVLEMFWRSTRTHLYQPGGANRARRTTVAIR